MKAHARVRRATSKTPGSVVEARVFFPTPRSAHFVIYVVDKGIWFDNLRRYRSGVDPHSPDLTPSCTAVAVLHTTALPAYRGLPELAEIEARVPSVADDIFRSHRSLFDRMDVANQGIQRVWVRAPLDIARTNVRSLNWRPFFLSELRSGTHKELLQLVVDLSCVEHRTRHCVPLLVDMKIHFALAVLWCCLCSLECTTITVGFSFGVQSMA